MRQGKRGSVNRIKDMEAAAPPVPPIEALRRNLLYAMFQGVTTDNMQAIVAKQVEKALEGDHKAAVFVRDMVQAGASQVGGVQNLTINNIEQQTNIFMAELRRQIVAVLAYRGPMATRVIADELRVMTDRVGEALDHEWFEQESDGWHISKQARTEVLGIAGE